MSSSSGLNKAKPPKVFVQSCSRAEQFCLESDPPATARRHRFRFGHCSVRSRMQQLRSCLGKMGFGFGACGDPIGTRSHGSRDSRQLSTTSCSRWGCKRPAQAMLRHGFAWRLDPSPSTRGPDVKAPQGGGDSFLPLSSAARRLFGFGQARVWLDLDMDGSSLGSAQRKTTTALVCRPSAARARRQSPCQTSIFGNDRSNPRLSVSSPTVEKSAQDLSLCFWLAPAMLLVGGWIFSCVESARSGSRDSAGEGGRLSNAQV